MIRRCAITESAAKLSLQLEAWSIPDDFEPVGGHRQTIEIVRDQFTNYKDLLKALPACPGDCPLLPDRLEGRSCASYNFSHDMLRAEAHQLATGLYAAWLSRRKEVAHPEPVALVAL